MSCCAPGAESGTEAGFLSPDELRHAARSLGNGIAQIELSVPAVHCGACIHAVEQGLSRLEGVVSARDLDLFRFVETADEAWKIVTDFYANIEEHH